MFLSSCNDHCQYHTWNECNVSSMSCSEQQNRTCMASKASWFFKHGLMILESYLWWPPRLKKTEETAVSGIVYTINKQHILALHWRHNGQDRVSNHQPHDCLLNRLFRRRSEKISKLRVTGLCVGNSPETGEFPAQMASYAENVSIWWRHHVDCDACICIYE